MDLDFCHVKDIFVFYFFQVFFQIVIRFRPSVPDHYGKNIGLLHSGHES